MEVVIPPRDHGSSTYRYTWDENGEVMQVTRVAGLQSQHPPQQHPWSEPFQRPRIGRQTVQWPFQSVVTETTEISSIFDPSNNNNSNSNSNSNSNNRTNIPRRATWEPRRLLSRGSDDSDTVAQDLIPDYVVNYLRGETPETLARKRDTIEKQGRQRVGLAHAAQHGRHQSRAAEFEGFYEDATSYSGSRSGRSLDGDGDEEQCILAEAARQGNSSSSNNNNNSSSSSSSSSGWRGLAAGWRAGVALHVLLAFLVLVAAFACLILAVSRVSLLAGDWVLYQGSCAAAARVDWGLHAAAAALAVVLLAGANYAAQVLVSPTRAELDAAHARGRWLDVGVPSVRNGAAVSGGRVLLAVVVLLAAVVTQVVYNAVVFTSRSAVPYSLVLVAPPFLTGAPFSNASASNAAGLTRLDLLSLQDLASRGRLANLTAADCLVRFGGTFQVDYAAALAVVATEGASPPSLSSTSPNPLIQTARADDVASPPPSLSRVLRERRRGGGGGDGDHDHDHDHDAHDGTLRFCLAQPAPAAVTSAPACSLHLNGALLGVATLLNLVSVVALAAVLFRPRFEPLVTLGDAVRSFLQSPDPTTAGACLLSRRDVRRGRWGLREAQYYAPSSGASKPVSRWWRRLLLQRREGSGAGGMLWLSAPSAARWCLAVFLWAALAGTAAAALAETFSASQAHPRLAGFGAADTFASSTAAHLLLFFPSSSSSSSSPPSPVPAAAALVASLPQLLLSCLYLAVDALLTTYYLSHESSLFYRAGQATQGRPLRVSSRPEGAQTTSLYLTLPRPWSWFLAVLFAAAGFALSQSVFVAAVTVPSSTTTPTTPTSSSPVAAIGVSSVGLVVLLALLALLALAVLACGLRRFEGGSGNPLVLRGGSCSAVISARCHPASLSPSRRRREQRCLWRRPLVWGAVRQAEGAEAGHCGFATAGRAEALVPGRSYA